MTMFTAKPKFNLAEFLATPAPSGASRSRSRSGSKMWQSRPAEEEAAEAVADADDAKTASKGVETE